MKDIFDIIPEEPEIETEPPEPYHVYVQTDGQSRITAVNSSAFVPAEWGAEIDSGFGDKYHHAQGNYFTDGLYTSDGIPHYKLVDGKAQERTEEEIQTDRDAIPAPIVPPTNAELEAENKMLRAQLQAATDRQDFIEDCIAEMAGVVYAV